MPKLTHNEPSPKELKQVQATLSKLKPGWLPEEIFFEICRLTVVTTADVVPLRKSNSGKIQVLLIERDKRVDPIWGGMMHIPGSIIKATDKQNSLTDALKRVLKGELMSVETSEPRYISYVFHRVERGTELTHIFWVEVLGDTSVGTFYDVDELPKNIIDFQISYVDKAVKAFKALNK
jgi:hypothetical protein